MTDVDVVFKNREGDVNFMKKASKLTHVFNFSPLRQPNNMSCGYYQCVLMDEIVCHFASCENEVQFRRNMTSLKERFDHNRELEGIIQFLHHLINVEIMSPTGRFHVPSRTFVPPKDTSPSAMPSTSSSKNNLRGSHHLR